MNTYIKYLKPIRLVFPFLMFILLMGCNNLKELLGMVLEIIRLQKT